MTHSLNESEAVMSQPLGTTSFHQRRTTRFPGGVLMLSFAEFWERFSFYGMLAILALYVTASVQDGGLGWSDQAGLGFYGLCNGMAFISPLLGGWIAHTRFGEKRCVLLGGLFIALGNGFIASPPLIYELYQFMFGVDFAHLLTQSGVPLGYILDGRSLAIIGENATKFGADKDIAVAAYLTVSLSFYIGIATIIAGTGLWKPTVTSLIGRFYDLKDPRRDSAYALFLLAISLGAIIGTAVIGFYSERVSWALGFAVAGIGMAVGLLVYVLRQGRYMANLVDEPEEASTGEVEAPSSSVERARVERDRLKALIIINLFAVIYCVVVFQGGLVALLAKTHVDRLRWGWEIPSSWFWMMNSIVFMVLAPILAWLWEKFAHRGRPVWAFRRLLFGLIAGGLAHLTMAYPLLFMHYPEHHLVSPAWLLTMTFLFGVGEAFAWAGVMSFVTRLVPRNLSSVAMGSAYFAMGVGAWVGSSIAALSYTIGTTQILLAFAGMAFTAAALLWALGPRISRLSHGME